MSLCILLIAAALCLAELSDCAKPLLVPVPTLNGTAPGACPPHAQLAEAREQLRAVVSSAVEQYSCHGNSIGSCSDVPVGCPTGFYWVATGGSSPMKTFCDFTATFPVHSCADLPLDSPAGYYWLLPTSSEPAVQRYCSHSESGGCGETDAWTRVGFLNMSDPTDSCPTAWTMYSSPRRTCGIGTLTSFSCHSMTISAQGVNYSKVCGRVVAYHTGRAEGFDFDIHSIEHPYLDGISITHGGANSRQHIWSFVTAAGEESSFGTENICDCSRNETWPHSTLIGNNYFCDTGNHNSTWVGPDNDYDPLWDGQGCGLSSTCCQFNNPPWFHASLPHPTSDDIEIRNCQGRFLGYDTRIELIEIFIQ